jgi:hypothetical protein
MTLPAYRSAVRLQLGVLPNDAVLTNETVDWGINGALRSIATEKDWPWLYTQEESTLTAGFRRWSARHARSPGSSA